MKNLKIAVAAASLCAIAMSPVANAQFAPPPPPPLDPVMLGVGGLALGAVAGLAAGSLGGDAGSSGSPGATVTPTVTAAPVTVTPTVTAGASTVTPTVTAPALTTTPTVTAGAVTVTSTATQTVTETVTAAPVTSTPRVTAPAVTVTPTQTAAPVTVTPTRTAAPVTVTPTVQAAPVTTTVVVTETTTKTVPPFEPTPGDNGNDAFFEVSLTGAGTDSAGNPVGARNDGVISAGEMTNYYVRLLAWNGGDGIGTFDITLRQDPELPFALDPITLPNGCAVTSKTRANDTVRVVGDCTAAYPAGIDIIVPGGAAPAAGSRLVYPATVTGTDKSGRPLGVAGFSMIDERYISNPQFTFGFSPLEQVFDASVEP